MKKFNGLAKNKFWEIQAEISALDVDQATDLFDAWIEDGLVEQTENDIATAIFSKRYTRDSDYVYHAVSVMQVEGESQEDRPSIRRL